jgi:Tfp pilus assembly protein PilF
MSRAALVFFVMVLFGAATLPGQDRPQPGQLGQSPGELPRIEGVVVLPNGNPVPHAYLRLESGDVGEVYQSATTDSGGYYSFAGNFAGSGVVIVVEVPGFRTIRRLVGVTSHATEEDFQLEPLPVPSEPDKGAVVSVKELQIPSQARTLYVQGVQHMDAGQYAVAESSFRKAIDIYPDYAASFRRLGAIYANQGRFGEAHQAIDRAFEIDNGGSENYAYLGYVYRMEKQLGKAEQAFEQSIGISKDDWFAQLELGRLRYEQRKYRDAYEHLAIADQLHPQVRSVHLLLYDDLIQLGKRKEALAELDNILARFPNCPEAEKLRKVRPALERSVSQGQP